MAYISSYKSAAAKETDAIKTIKDNRKTMSFCKYLLGCKTDVETLTAHHLGLASGQRCVMLGLQEWIAGRFNVCIPVSVTDTDGTCRKVMMRCAIPHMMAEDTHPGTIEEKMRCEVATYAYFQEECPEIPIPHLFGFCLPDGQKVHTLVPEMQSLALTSIAVHAFETSQYLQTAGSSISSMVLRRARKADSISVLATPRHAQTEMWIHSA